MVWSEIKGKHFHISLCFLFRRVDKFCVERKSKNSNQINVNYFFKLSEWNLLWISHVVKNTIDYIGAYLVSSHWQ